MEGWTEGRVVEKLYKRGQGSWHSGEGMPTPETKGSPETMIRAEKGRYEAACMNRYGRGRTMGSGSAERKAGSVTLRGRQGTQGKAIQQ